MSNNGAEPSLHITRETAAGLECAVCKAGGNSLPAECPGRPMTLTELEGVAARKLEFHYDRWEVLD